MCQAWEGEKRMWNRIESNERARQAECDHDWRVDPRVILPTNPPSSRLVCATCGAHSSRMNEGYPTSNDPKDWPKV
jgi:hypothetical protein